MGGLCQILVGTLKVVVVVVDGSVEGWEGVTGGVEDVVDGVVEGGVGEVVEVVEGGVEVLEAMVGVILEAFAVG